MADNSDNVLNILVKLGVVGQQDVATVKQLLGETAAASAQLNGKIADSAGAIERYTKQNEELGEAEEKTAGQTRGSAASHLALQMAFDKLNEVVPGLGGYLNLLTQGYRESAEAAEAVGGANTSFIASLGPMAVVLLSIQAAIEYWDIYKDKVKAAAEAQTASFKKMDDVLRSSMQLWTEYNKVIHGDDDKDPVKKYSETAQRDTEVLRAHVEGNKELLRVQEAQAVAAAKTPEEKERIRNEFAFKNQQQANFEETAGASIKKSEMGYISTDITRRMAASDDLRKQVAKAGSQGDPSRVTELNQQWSEQIDAIKQLKGELGRLGNETMAERDIHDVHTQTQAQVAAQNAQTNGTVEAGVSALVANSHGPINQAQQRAYNDLRNLFTTVNGNTDNLIAAIKYGHDHALSNQQEIDLIKQQLQNLAAQTKQSAYTVK